jgi:CRISPR-associated protein (TIGR02584 family)
MREKILVALCGMSPAVITETVYALVKEKGVVPNKVIVITTTAGRYGIREQLFSSGVWDALMMELGVDVEFADSAYHIRLIPNSTATGDAEDIVTSEDSTQRWTPFFDHWRFVLSYSRSSLSIP